MKISNETKVGAIAVLSILLFILGFNFLKGNNLWNKKMILYAKYNNVEGLTNSNPVMINGLKIGSVKDITNDMDMKSLLVTIELNQKINIPNNSIALIIPNPLGNTKIEIKLGDSPIYLKNKDSLITKASKGLLDNVLQNVDPLLFEVKNSVKSLDSLIGNINTIFDNHTKDNISATVDNLNKLSASLLISSSSIEKILNNQTGSVAKTINNIESVTSNLSRNNNKINSLISNLDKSAYNFSALDLQSTLHTIDSTIKTLQLAFSNTNGKGGSLGLFLNDPALYRNLTATSNKLNLLLDDVRVHPKRYISVSVFGKSNKEKSLKIPLPDSVNAPYLIQQ